MKIKLRWKKLQKDEYIFFVKGGRRTYLVHSKVDSKKLKKVIDDMVKLRLDGKDKMKYGMSYKGSKNKLVG